MSVYKLAATVVCLAFGVAIVTALAAVSPEAKRDAVAAKTPSPEAACPQAPWPYGCQWHEPSHRLSRSPRASRPGARRAELKPALRLTESWVSSRDVTIARPR